MSILLILGAGLLAERLLVSLAGLELRAAVLAETDAIRSRLEIALDERLSALSRLQGAMSADPRMDAATAAELARNALSESALIRAVGARSPDGLAAIEPAADPLAATLAAILSAAPGESTATVTAAGSGAPSILVQGTDGRTRIAAAFDLAAIQAIATPRGGAGIEIALVDATAGEGKPLVGRPELLRTDPVALDLAFPYARWRIAAAPAAGWTVTPDTVWGVRGLTALAVMLFFGPALRSRRLVTERRDHIAALRAREAELGALSRRLGLALDASRVGVFDYDLKTGTLLWDERMDALHELPRDGGARRYADWRDRLHPEDRARAEEEFRAAAAAGGRYESSFRLVLRNGAQRHIRAIGAVHVDPDGAAKLVGVNLDVTADVRGRAELDAKRLEAEAASIAKSQFLATMSHEIRTPMNGVLGMIDLLMRTPLDAEQRDRAEVAQDCAQHLLSILNDILEFSRLEACGAALSPAPVDVAATIQSVAALLGPSAEARGLRLTATVDPATPERIVCDGTRLRQVVINLVGNALKFTDRGAVEIHVGYTATFSGSFLDVAVRDTGIGIPAEACDRIFGRFAQADGSSACAQGGTGLGLAISRQLVELMGGEITVESRPGEGSTFRFWIPAPACVAPLPAAAAPRRVDYGPPRRILLAEDNPTNRLLFEAYLALAGHSVRSVENGARAVEVAAEERFDAVVMDIQMPGLDGRSASRRIRELPEPACSVPILALTADVMAGDVSSYRTDGMDDYLPKPVTADAFLLAVARLAAGPSGTTDHSEAPAVSVASRRGSRV